jgi:hypothetical protein
MNESHDHIEENTKVICNDCSKKLYPNSGKFTEKQLKEAKLVKAMFTEEGKMAEHMWVKVKEVVTENKITNIHGYLDNDPVNLEKITMGDQVMVSASKVEDVRLTLEPIEKREVEEETPTCEICEEEYPMYLDTGITRYLLCFSHLADLTNLDLNPKDVKALRELHGNEDFYLSKTVYDKKGHQLELHDQDKKE